MTAPGPGREPELIVAPENDRRGAVGDLEGAGVLSSWSDLGEALPTDRQWDPGEIGFAASAVALDSLDAAMDPLGALGSAGVGWLIEHVEFLHEPLDWLAGESGTDHRTGPHLAQHVRGARPGRAGLPGAA